MSETTYPSGYGRDELTLGQLMDRHLPAQYTEPEFRRRVRGFIEWKGGVLGFGDILPRSMTADISPASAAGRSFHQRQRFHDGTWWASAIDLVVRRPGLGHSSGAVPWSDVPIQGSAYAECWGLHVNVPGESWHLQPIEYDGFLSWDRAGRPRPTPGYGIPTDQLPPPPPLVFDPRNGRFGLWPVKTDKPRLSTRVYSDERRMRADTRWLHTGDAVLYLQGVILHKCGGNITVDGNFGPQTERRVKDVQSFFGKAVDGLVGAETWGIIDYCSGL